MSREAEGETPALVAPGSRVSGACGGLAADGAVEVAADAVVLATGGFEWDKDLLRAFIRGPMTHPLFKHENFYCTPHMAWHSEESAQELKRKAAEETRRVLRGEAPWYQVNKF